MITSATTILRLPSDLIAQTTLSYPLTIVVKGGNAIF